MLCRHFILLVIWCHRLLIIVLRRQLLLNDYLIYPLILFLLSPYYLNSQSSNPKFAFSSPFSFYIYILMNIADGACSCSLLWSAQVLNCSCSVTIHKICVFVQQWFDFFVPNSLVYMFLIFSVILFICSQFFSVNLLIFTHMLFLSYFPK